MLNQFIVGAVEDDGGWGSDVDGYWYDGGICSRCMGAIWVQIHGLFIYLYPVAHVSSGIRERVHRHCTLNGREVELNGVGRGKTIELVPRLHMSVTRLKWNER